MLEDYIQEKIDFSLKKVQTLAIARVDEFFSDRRTATLTLFYQAEQGKDFPQIHEVPIWNQAHHHIQHSWHLEEGDLVLVAFSPLSFVDGLEEKRVSSLGGFAHHFLILGGISRESSLEKSPAWGNKDTYLHFQEEDNALVLRAGNTEMKMTSQGIFIEVQGQKYSFESTGVKFDQNLFIQNKKASVFGHMHGAGALVTSQGPVTGITGVEQ